MTTEDNGNAGEQNKIKERESQFLRKEHNERFHHFHNDMRHGDFVIYLEPCPSPTELIRETNRGERWKGGIRNILAAAPSLQSTLGP